MEEYPVALRGNSRTRGYIVGAIYRQALIDLGCSPDSHVYDIDESCFCYRRGSASNLFLRRVKRMYDSLKGLERKVFLCDYLEKGRHYPFWYLEFVSREDYEKSDRELRRRLSKAFN